MVFYDYTTGTSYMKYKPYVSYGLGNGLTASAYLQGDTQTNPNYEPQVELDWAPVAGATIKTQVFYDTAPSHLSSDKANTTFESDFILSF